MQDLDGSILPLLPRIQYPQPMCPIQLGRPISPIQFSSPEPINNNLIAPRFSRRSQNARPRGPHPRAIAQADSNKSDYNGYSGGNIPGPRSPRIQDQLDFLRQQINNDVQDQLHPMVQAQRDIETIRESLEVLDTNYTQQSEWLANAETVETQNSQNLGTLQQQNTVLTTNMGALNQNLAHIPKEVDQLQTTLWVHAKQLECIERNQQECHTTLDALMEMIQGLDEQITHHEESEHSSNTERSNSWADSVRSASDQYVFPPPQRASTPNQKRKNKGPKEAKTQRPDKYKGKQGMKAEDFITRMEVYFLNYHNYFTDNKKILATLNNMSKHAPVWARSYLKQILNGERHKHLQLWSSFKKAFLTSFGNTMKREKAIKAIGELKQNASATLCTTQFWLLVEELGWEEETLIGIYKKGLKSGVLCHVMPVNMNATQRLLLEDVMDFAIQTNRINFTPRNRENDNKGKRSDQGRARSFSNMSKPNDRKRVPKKVISRRMKEGFCIKCGKGGHCIKDCLSKEYLHDPIQGKEATIKEVKDNDSEPSS